MNIRRIRNYKDLAQYQARLHQILTSGISNVDIQSEASVLNDYIVEYVDALHNGVHWQYTLEKAVTEHEASRLRDSTPLLMTITHGVDDENPWAGCFLRINQLCHNAFSHMLDGNNYYIYEAIIPHIDKGTYRQIANLCWQLGLKCHVGVPNGDSTWRFGVVPIEERLRIWKGFSVHGG